MLEIVNEFAQLQTRWAAVEAAALTMLFSGEVRELDPSEFPRVAQEHGQALQAQRLLGGDPYGAALN